MVRSRLFKKLLLLTVILTIISLGYYLVGSKKTTPKTKLSFLPTPAKTDTSLNINSLKTNPGVLSLTTTNDTGTTSNVASSLIPSDFNLLFNSSFEGGQIGYEPKGWSYILNSSLNNTKVDNSSVRTGTLSLKFEDAGANPTQPTTLGISQPITKTINGRDYILSVNIRTSNLSGNPTLRIGFLGGTADDKFQDYTISPSNTSGWKTFTFAYTNAGLSKYPFIQISNYQGGKIYLDDLRLYELSNNLSNGLITSNFNSGAFATAPSSTIYQSLSKIGDGSLTVDSSGNIFPSVGTGIGGINFPTSVSVNGGLYVSGSSRTVDSRLSDIINVKDYGAKGDGVTDDYAAITTAITAAQNANACLYFPAATYAFATPISVSAALCIKGNRSVLKYTGGSTTNAIYLGGSAYTPNFRLIEVVIDGRSATNALYLDHVVRSQFDSLRIRGATGGSGVYCNTCSINTFDSLVISNQSDGYSVTPTYGVSVDGGAAADNTFINAIVEGVSSHGFNLISEQSVHLIGGTSESNGGWGVFCSSSTCLFNTFIGTDFEANTLGDVSIRNNNALYNIIAFSTTGVVFTAGDNLVSGGRITTITVNSGATDNIISGVNITGSITDNGTRTDIRQTNNVTSGSPIADNIPRSVTMTDSITTTGTAFTASSSAVTSGTILKVGEGGNSAFTGNAIFADIDNTGGGGTSFTGNFLRFDNAGTTKVTISSNGITTLTTTNFAPLILSSSDLSNGVNIKLISSGGTNPNKWLRSLSGNFQVLNSAFSAALLTLQDGGNVGIGTASPIGKFVLTGAPQASGNALAILNQTNTTTNDDILTASTSGTVHFRIKNNGALIADLPGTGTANALCHTTQTGVTQEEVVDCTSAPAADYAEQYPVEKSVTYGDVVAVGIKDIVTKDGQTIKQLVKSNSEYQDGVIGIVSDNHNDFTSAGYNINKSDNPYPIALNGRVPVKVTSASAAINAGDFVATSAEPGRAMKARRNGYIIGKALESWTPGKGKDTVMVFVNNTYLFKDSVGFPSITDLQKDGVFTITGILKVNDRTTLEREVSLGSDSAGIVKIQKGDSEVKITFDKEYKGNPVVNITPLGKYETKYWVSDINTKGFVIRIDPSLSDDAQFSWTAFSIAGTLTPGQ